MKNSIIALIYLIATMSFIVGCSNSGGNESYNIEDVALKEAEKIAIDQVYSLKLEEVCVLSDTLVYDSEVFKLIKNASIQGGYSEDDFESMTENRKVVGYELEEKSKKDKLIMLCLVTDNEKIIGAYLNYYGYDPGVEPIGFKDNFK